MDRLSIKMVFQLVFVIALLLLIPIITEAADIQWTSQRYGAWAMGSGWSNCAWAFGPPLPISAVCTEGQSSYISNSTVIVKSKLLETSSIASFEGRYIANEPYLKLQYDFDSSGSDHTYFLVYADKDNVRQTLYNVVYHFEPSASDMIFLPTPIGSEVTVAFDTEVLSYGFGGIPFTATINYSMSTASVAPEPLSYILFVTGGTLLAVRIIEKVGRIAVQFIIRNDFCVIAAAIDGDVY